SPTDAFYLIPEPSVFFAAVGRSIASLSCFVHRAFSPVWGYLPCECDALTARLVLLMAEAQVVEPEGAGSRAPGKDGDPGRARRWGVGDRHRRPAAAPREGESCVADHVAAGVIAEQGEDTA